MRIKNNSCCGLLIYVAQAGRQQPDHKEDKGCKHCMIKHKTQNINCYITAIQLQTITSKTQIHYVEKSVILSITTIAWFAQLKLSILELGCQLDGLLVQTPAHQNNSGHSKRIIYNSVYALQFLKMGINQHFLLSAVISGFDELQESHCRFGTECF